MKSPVTKHCTKCRTDKSMDSFARNASVKSGKQAHCKECTQIYRNANKELTSIRNREYRKRNKVKASLYHKQWKQDNKSKVTANHAKRRSMKLNATVSWADNIKIQRKYTQAQLKSVLFDEDYHVDHIVPLQGKEVCGLHVEYNLQVIPATENLSKGNTFNG